MSGDLRAVLADERHYVTPFKPADRILAALHAADEPLVSEVEVYSSMIHDRTVRIVAMTEDVLRARLADVLAESDFRLPASAESGLFDAIVRAILGEES